MQVGQLRHNVTLQSRDPTDDANGQPSLAWLDVATVWASIEALSAREFFAAQSVQTEVSHKITVRYQPELANPKAVAGMRVTYAGRIFNIAGAMNVDERNRVIELMAAEGLNNG